MKEEGHTGSYEVQGMRDWRAEVAAAVHVRVPWAEVGVWCSSAVRRQNGETERSFSLLVIKSCYCCLPAWCSDYSFKGNEVTQQTN